GRKWHSHYFGLKKESASETHSQNSNLRENRLLTWLRLQNKRSLRGLCLFAFPPMMPRLHVESEWQLEQPLEIYVCFRVGHNLQPDQSSRVTCEPYLHQTLMLHHGHGTYETSNLRLLKQMHYRLAKLLALQREDTFQCALDVVNGLLFCQKCECAAYDGTSVLTNGHPVDFHKKNRANFRRGPSPVSLENVRP